MGHADSRLECAAGALFRRGVLPSTGRQPSHLPVYYPGREPAGYWDMLNSVGPRPLIDRSELKTEGRLDQCWSARLCGIRHASDQDAGCCGNCRSTRCRNLRQISCHGASRWNPARRSMGSYRKRGGAGHFKLCRLPHQTDARRHVTRGRAPERGNQPAHRACRTMGTVERPSSR